MKRPSDSLNQVLGSGPPPRQREAITLKCEPTTCAGQASKNDGAPNPLRGLVLRHRNHGAGERAVGLSQRASYLPEHRSSTKQPSPTRRGVQQGSTRSRLPSLRVPTLFPDLPSALKSEIRPGSWTGQKHRIDRLGTTLDLHLLEALHGGSMDRRG